MRRLQKSSSTAQRQECLSVSDTTVQHEKKKKKMLEYYKNIKKAELVRHTCFNSDVLETWLTETASDSLKTSVTKKSIS